MDEERARRVHRTLKGKTEVSLKQSIESRADLADVYTPGVGVVSADIGADLSKVWEYTGKGNMVAVVSDGSAILGLGDLGPEAALPVMEGKCALFKRFAGINAVPIVLDVHSAQEIIAAVRAIAPSFGAINLEDIAAPKCFEIESTLARELPIPVMHDDQHGTAIVVLAGLINAAKVRGKPLADLSVVVNGAGAAGVAIMRILASYGVRSICAVDSKGIISNLRSDLTPEKRSLLIEGVIVGGRDGALADALVQADVFIGVSKARVLTADHVRSMAPEPIIFALANPEPEIMPDEAYAAGACIVATGRSDFPNQINNVIAYPGVFRGVLDARIPKITEPMKRAAAEALAELVDAPDREHIIPDVFDPRVVPAVAARVQACSQ
ncbi:NADP-dependent malic enzyme [Patescibacteria group bacterium]|nr:NADP-dependent malic enzyme [Patescibacteria group bacterium]